MTLALISVLGPQNHGNEIHSTTSCGVPSPHPRGSTAGCRSTS